MKKSSNPNQKRKARYDDYIDADGSDDDIPDQSDYESEDPDEEEILSDCDSEDMGLGIGAGVYDNELVLFLSLSLIK